MGGPSPFPDRAALPRPAHVRAWPDLGLRPEPLPLPSPHWRTGVLRSESMLVAAPPPCRPATGGKEDLTHFRNETSEDLEGEGRGVVRTAPGVGVGLTGGIPTGGCGGLVYTSRVSSPVLQLSATRHQLLGAKTRGVEDWLPGDREVLAWYDCPQASRPFSCARSRWAVCWLLRTWHAYCTAWRMA